MGSMKLDEDVETEIPDVSTWNLEAIITEGLKDPYLEDLLKQVERPEVQSRW